MLNWKVKGPALLSVALAIQVMDLPIGWGEGWDGVKDVMVTLAKAGTDIAVSNPMRKGRILLEFFMNFRSCILKVPVRDTGSCSRHACSTIRQHLAFSYLDIALACNRSNPSGVE